MCTRIFDLPTLTGETKLTCSILDRSMLQKLWTSFHTVKTILLFLLDLSSLCTIARTIKYANKHCFRSSDTLKWSLCSDLKPNTRKSSGTSLFSRWLGGSRNDHPEDVDKPYNLIASSVPCCRFLVLLVTVLYFASFSSSLLDFLLAATVRTTWRCCNLKRVNLSATAIGQQPHGRETINSYPNTNMCCSPVYRNSTTLSLQRQSRPVSIRGPVLLPNYNRR